VPCSSCGFQGLHVHWLFSHGSDSWIFIPCHSCGFQGLVIICCLATLVNRGSYALPLLWIPGPRHYLLFSHVSKSWFGVSCHSCGFQDLIITCYLATLVNCGSVCPATLVDSRTIVVMGSFSVCSFLSCQQCHEFLLYVLVMTIEVVNCFSAYGPSQVCSFTW